MERDQRAIDKLIILDILAQAPGLTVNQLMAQALGTLCLDYFAFVSAFDELLRDRLAMSGVRKEEELTDSAGQPVARCDITPQGRGVLAALAGRIPLPIRSYLATSLASLRRDQRRENTITALAEPDANGFYTVRLRQNDGLRDTVDLRLTVPNLAIAETLCSNWKAYPQTLYLGLLNLLSQPAGTAEPHPQPDESPAGPAANDFPDRQLCF